MSYACKHILLVMAASIDSLSLQSQIFAIITSTVIAYEEQSFEVYEALTGQVCKGKLNIFTIQASVIGCAFACFRRPGCFGSSYDVTSGTCRACYPTVNETLLVTSWEATSGMVFHRRVPRGSNCTADPVMDPATVTASLDLGDAVYDFLVAGTYLAVPDSHLTASSYYIGHHGAYAPTEARMCAYLFWAPSPLTSTTQWIQVRFFGVSEVFAVVTRGRWSFHHQWMTAYTVLYSVDCGAFTSVVDVGNATMVFTGNTDRNTPVYNILPEPVTALCIRVNPVGWNKAITMRFDVIGHTF